MLKLIICKVCLILTLSGCTVAGFVVDSTVYTKADENYEADLALSHPSETVKSKHLASDVATLSFTDLGLAVDRYLVELVQQGVEPDVVCTRVSKSVKICEEVNTHNLTGTESNQADTVDEIIGVRL
ncbi:hypothetical protein [Pseudoalteromonas sp. SaAl2]